MRIVGQSTLANGSPYVHLAYLSAVHVEPQPAVWNGTVLIVMSGVAMALIAGVGVWLAWFKSKSSQWVWTLLICLMLAAIATMAIAAHKHGETYRRWPTGPTASTAERILNEIVARNKDRQKWLPKDMSEARSVLGASTTDEWSREMNLECADDDGISRYAVVSAGPDGQFDTPDDIRVLVWIGGPIQPVGPSDPQPGRRTGAAKHLSKPAITRGTK